MLDAPTRLRLHGEFGPICLTTQVENQPCTEDRTQPTTFASAIGILIRNYVGKHPRMLGVVAQHTPREV